MHKIIRIFFTAAVIAGITGCDRHPFKKVSTLRDEGLLPSVNATFIVYDDELKTGGNLFVFPGGENQTVELKWQDRPYRGKNCIMYSWNGRDVNDGNLGITRHDFVGLDLVVSEGSGDFAASSSLDLSAGAYAKATFWIRGTLSEGTTLKVESPDDGSTATAAPQLLITSISETWQKNEITIAASDLTALKEFFKITFVYTQPTGTTTPGGGGTVFLDDIRLEQ